MILTYCLIQKPELFTTCDVNIPWLVKPDWFRPITLWQKCQLLNRMNFCFDIVNKCRKIKLQHCREIGANEIKPLKQSQPNIKPCFLSSIGGSGFHWIQWKPQEPGFPSLHRSHWSTAEPVHAGHSGGGNGLSGVWYVSVSSVCSLSVWYCRVLVAWNKLTRWIVPVI